MKVLWILGMILGLDFIINAQTAVLSGTVYDVNGSLIAGAKVTAINEKLETHLTLSNSDGVYELNLPFKKYDSKESFKTAKYVLLVESMGFEKFVLKGINFVPSTKGVMNLDFALDINFNSKVFGSPILTSDYLIQSDNTKLSNEIISKPLVKLPKAQNKNKGKTKLINNE